MTGVSGRASRALAHLAEVDAALAVLALWCQHRDGTGDTVTEGDRISYGPGFETLGLPEQVGTVAHHVLHVALRHTSRAGTLSERMGDSFDPVLFGLAADGIVNETLVLAGHAIPHPAIRLGDVLRQAGLPSESMVDALSRWDVERLALQLHADTGRMRRLREWAAERGFKTDLRPVSSRTEGEALSDMDWHNQMIRALEAGRRAGSGIGRIGAILADLAPGGVPWEVHLRGLLARALVHRPTTTWQRPSSRWIAGTAEAKRIGGPFPAYEPGRRWMDRRPRICVGLDASSSISPLSFDLFGRELQAIQRKTRAEVHVCAFDTEVFVALRLEDGDWARLGRTEFRRGGGTDYHPLFRHAAALDPAILVVLTDLDAPLPQKPAFPVLWAACRSAKPPAYGHVVTMETGANGA